MDQETHQLIRPLLQLTNEYQKEFRWLLTNAIFHNELCKFFLSAFWGREGKRLCNLYCISSMLNFEISVIVGNWEYQLKKSCSTVIRYLYGRVNQNKSNLQNQIKSEEEQQNNTMTINKHVTHFRPFIEFTSNSNWSS